ncbi:hypothetical protein B296_00014311 [Ensete ventricosum]|uniref:Uncharacterized protein n=1 Tax=Ensete ventricosum TaxID=4639 RepID=A0A426ZK92_ENSVE|nr:hypothetical protein B296_00014311 [Ensete ventricosum]
MSNRIFRPIRLSKILQEFAPEPVCLLCARADQVERALKAHSHDAIIPQPHGKDLDLVSIILPDNNGSFYGMLPVMHVILFVGVMLRENALNPTGFAGSFLFPVKELLDKSLSKLHSTGIQLD